MLYVKYAVLLLFGFLQSIGIVAEVQYGIRHRDPDTDTGEMKRFPRSIKKSTDGAKMVHQSSRGQNPAEKTNVRGVDRTRNLLKRSGYTVTITEPSSGDFIREQLIASSRLDIGHEYDNDFDKPSFHRRVATDISGMGPAPQAGSVGNDYTREPPFPLTGEDPWDPPSPHMGDNHKNPLSNALLPSTNPTPSPTPNVYLSQHDLPRGGNDPTSAPTSNVYLSQLEVPRDGVDPTSSPTSNVYLSQLQVPRGDGPTSAPTSNVFLSQLQVSRGGDDPTSSPTSNVHLSQLQVTKNGKDDDAETTPSNDGLSINNVDIRNGYLARTHERTPSNDPFDDDEQ